MTDPRQYAPAAARNRDAILAVLRRFLPPNGQVLEIASGSGEHAAHFATALPGCVFQPSDPDAGRRASIDAWAANSRLVNIRPALALDAMALEWRGPKVDAVLCLNMIHIAPWEATRGLVRNASSVLRRGGMLILYGPFKRGGAHTAPSNEAFDTDLRARDARWGIRDLERVALEAVSRGFTAPEVVAMPANNLSVVFHC